MHFVLMCGLIWGLKESLLVLTTDTSAFNMDSLVACRRNTPIQHERDSIALILKRLNWRILAVISDRGHVWGPVLSELEQGYTKLEIFLLPFPSEGTSSPTEWILTNIWRTLKSNNILIAGNECLQRESLKQMQLLADQAEPLSRAVFDTRWLLLVNSHVIQTANLTSLQLNNVAFVVYNEKDLPVAIKTLVWTENRCRSTRDVTLAPLDSDLSTHLFPNAQYGLNGLRLRVGINIWAPYVIEHYDNVTHERTYSGLCLDLLVILSHTLNFSYELVVPPDGEWGDYRDGNWTGLEVDVVVATITPTYERSFVADWTLPYDYYYFAVVVRNKESQFHLWTAFLSPFTWEVYLCVLLSFTCCTCILVFLVAAETRSWNKVFPRVLDVAEYLFGSLVSEALPTVWSHGASRGFIAGWCLLSLVLTSSYTCKLTSLLVSVAAPPPFTSLADMVALGDFRWGVIPGSSLLMDLRQSTDKVHQAVYRGLFRFAQDDPDVLSFDVNVHLSKVLTERYAFIGESITLRKWAADRCDVTLVSAEINGLQSYNIFTPKQSTLTKRMENV
ncbi:hypothetical protein BaRGS_00032626 [Batillaria attramentaria]|uniref:Uncharacterized protein n=1 Tax=Batillaria attramentaria TaxID=370345 RepID=A0ABD0JMY4_9CAEN